MPTLPNILLVDDLQENLFALESLLEGEAANLHRARSGPEALELLLRHDFALALIDVRMPIMDGFELAELMRGTERTRAIPIIFVTAGAQDERRAFQGYDSGAVDFLYKPLDPHVVRSKVRVFCELKAQLLATQEARLQAESAIRVRDDFLSIASHELRTPLTAMLLQLQMVQRTLDRDGATPKSTEKLLRLVGTSLKQVGTLQLLIDDLLDVSRITGGKLQLRPEPTSLSEIARDVVEKLREQARVAGSELTFREESAAEGVWDPHRIEQVVINLVSNAIKYGGGKPIEVCVASEGAWRRLVVRDQGDGIPEEDLERIFDRFERVTKLHTVQGLGLGLYIVRKIMEAHGGTVRAESRPGQGSAFVAELPAH